MNNKGEHSEPQALFTLVHCPSAPSCALDGTHIGQHIIKRVARYDGPNGSLRIYERQSQNSYIVTDANKNKTTVVLDNMGELLADSLKVIKKSHGTFDNPPMGKILRAFGTTTVTGGAAGSGGTHKEDCLLELEGRNRLEGFSIKSELGAPPAIINGSGQTMFNYEIQGLSDDLLSKIYARSSTMQVWQVVCAIRQHGGTLKYLSTGPLADPHKASQHADKLSTDGTILWSPVIVVFYDQPRTDACGLALPIISRVSELVKIVIKDQTLITVGGKRWSNSEATRALSQTLESHSIDTTPSGERSNNTAPGGIVLLKRDGGIELLLMSDTEIFKARLYGAAIMNVPFRKLWDNKTAHTGLIVPYERSATVADKIVKERVYVIRLPHTVRLDLKWKPTTT